MASVSTTGTISQFKEIDRNQISSIKGADVPEPASECQEHAVGNHQARQEAIAIAVNKLFWNHIREPEMQNVFKALDEGKLQFSVTGDTFIIRNHERREIHQIKDADLAGWLIRKIAGISCERLHPSSASSASSVSSSSSTVAHPVPPLFPNPSPSPSSTMSPMGPPSSHFPTPIGPFPLTTPSSPASPFTSPSPSFSTASPSSPIDFSEEQRLQRMAGLERQIAALEAKHAEKAEAGKPVETQRPQSISELKAELQRYQEQARTSGIDDPRIRVIEHLIGLKEMLEEASNPPSSPMSGEPGIGIDSSLPPPPSFPMPPAAPLSMTNPTGFLSSIFDSAQSIPEHSVVESGTPSLTSGSTLTFGLKPRLASPVDTNTPGTASLQGRTTQLEFDFSSKKDSENASGSSSQASGVAHHTVSAAPRDAASAKPVPPARQNLPAKQEHGFFSSVTSHFHIPQNPFTASSRKAREREAQRRIMETGINWLEEKGKNRLATDGIFRTSGSSNGQTELAKQITGNSKYIIPENTPVETVACAVKAAMKQLCQDQMVFDVKELEEFNALSNDAAKIAFLKDKVQEKLASAGEDQVRTLRKYFSLLQKVAGQVHLNQMSHSNLGIIVGPAITPNLTETDIHLVHVPNQIAKMMIEHIDEILDANFLDDLRFPADQRRDSNKGVTRDPSPVESMRSRIGFGAVYSRVNGPQVQWSDDESHLHESQRL